MPGHSRAIGRAPAHARSRMDAGASRQADCDCVAKMQFIFFGFSKIKWL